MKKDFSVKIPQNCINNKYFLRFILNIKNH